MNLKSKVISLMKFVLLISIITENVSAREISCEKVENWKWWLNTFKTCQMNVFTVLNTTGVVLAGEKDESVKGFWSNGNQLISQLPEHLGKKFPKLLLYDASRCGLTSINKKNFEAMNELKYLYLSHNKIEKVPTDSFSDLLSIENLYLVDNKIKYLNGATFQRNQKLTILALELNICIHKNFDDSNQMGTMENFINRKCGYCETCEIIEKIDKIIELQEKKCGELMTKTVVELAELKSKYEELKETLVKKDIELSAEKIKNQWLEKKLEILIQ